MRLVMGICERIVVLDFSSEFPDKLPLGIKATKGTEAYLGEEVTGNAADQILPSSQLSVSYDGIRAGADNISFDVASGEIVTLIRRKRHREVIHPKERFPV